ncbi:hypothetical protein PMAYCL1PPCAC_04138, partial [Pristionchus mayeri]
EPSCIHQDSLILDDYEEICDMIKQELAKDQKCHYATLDDDFIDGPDAETIAINELNEWYSHIVGRDIREMDE